MKILRSIFLLGLLLVFSVLNNYTYKSPSIESASLSPEAVLYYLRGWNIQHRDIVYAQVNLETGYLTSNAALEYNNLFGFMKSKNNYYKYDSWKESIAHYKQWQSKRYKSGNYYRFLEKVHYATDSNYTYHLKRMNKNGYKRVHKK